MTDFYDNPLLDALNEDDLDAALAQDAARPKRGGFSPLPRGRYTALLTDWGTETVDHPASPLCGKTRIRATFETEHDGRQRRIFADFTTEKVTWPPREGETTPTIVREFVLGAHLTKALGMRGKPFSEILEAARTNPVDLEVGIDRKKTDRNVVYAVHSTVRG